MKRTVELGRKFLYRIFCVISLIVTLYLFVDLYLSHTLNVKVMVLFGIIFSVILFGLLDWGRNYAALQRQEQEIRLYKLYIKPMEELTKDIRARQHEFDNHMNAILSMHVTIDNYDELVKAQSAYAKNIYGDKSRCNPALLRISDKILAGFLYSKIISAPNYIDIEIQVLSQEIVTPVSEHSLVEIIGTLTDNAFEAATPVCNKVEIVLDAKKDKLIFMIKNQVENLTIGDISHFFEKGFTTKDNFDGRGLGLYQACQIAKRHNSEITVELIEQEKGQEICFRVEI